MLKMVLNEKGIVAGAHYDMTSSSTPAVPSSQSHHNGFGVDQPDNVASRVAEEEHEGVEGGVYL